jgi:nucleoid DNA-binding protein
MNKAELVDAVADRTGQTKSDTDKTLNALLETVIAAVAQNDSVMLVGFGTFKSARRGARTGRNPATGEALSIAEATVPKFVPGATFKTRVAEAAKPATGGQDKKKK